MQFLPEEWSATAWTRTAPACAIPTTQPTRSSPLPAPSGSRRRSRFARGDLRLQPLLELRRIGAAARPTAREDSAVAQSAAWPRSSTDAFPSRDKGTRRDTCVGQREGRAATASAAAPPGPPRGSEHRSRSRRARGGRSEHRGHPHRAQREAGSLHRASRQLRRRLHLRQAWPGPQALQAPAATTAHQLARRRTDVRPGPLVCDWRGCARAHGSHPGSCSATWRAARVAGEHASSSRSNRRAPGRSIRARCSTPGACLAKRRATPSRAPSRSSARALAMDSSRGSG